MIFSRQESFDQNQNFKICAQKPEECKMDSSFKRYCSIGFDLSLHYLSFWNGGYDDFQNQWLIFKKILIFKMAWKSLFQ